MPTLSPELISFLKFSTDKSKFIKDLFKPSFKEVEDSQPLQIQYLYYYLEKLGCKQMILEDQYFSSSFMYDLSTFHIHSADELGKFTQRVHFFKENVSQKQFYSTYIKLESNFLQKNYLGTVIIKPFKDLKKKLGITLLISYNMIVSENHKIERFFNSTITYNICLVGKELAIKTLGLVGQDELARCSQSSLFAINQWASEKLYKERFHPGQLTKYITRLFGDARRAFPSGGLSHSQICQFLQHQKLTFDKLDVSNSDIITYNQIEKAMFEKEVTYSLDKVKDFKEKSERRIKGMIYAYSSASFPILLSIYRRDAKTTRYELHMVTVTGFRLNSGYNFPDQDFISDRIDIIYCNDDNLGVNTSFNFINNFEKEEGFKIDSNEYENFFTRISNDAEPRHLDTAVSLIVPTPRTINITYNDINSFVWEKLSLNNYTKSEVDKYLYDLKLMNSNDFKKEIIIQKGILPDFEKTLNLSLPKYIWFFGVLDENGEKLGYFIFHCNADKKGEKFMIHKSAFTKTKVTDFNAFCTIFDF